MMLEAKPIIKNKFWIVEDGGQKVATIQASPDGVFLVKGSAREKFVNFKLLSTKYNIRVNKGGKDKKIVDNSNNIYDFPVDCTPFNELYDVRRKLPFYTKAAKSKSFYCAGYYVVKIDDHWENQFCPKSITINRYPYFGPYKSETEALTKLVGLA